MRPIELKVRTLNLIVLAVALLGTAGIACQPAPPSPEPARGGILDDLSLGRVALEISTIT